MANAKKKSVENVETTVAPAVENSVAEVAAETPKTKSTRGSKASSAAKTSKAAASKETKAAVKETKPAVEKKTTSRKAAPKQKALTIQDVCDKCRAKVMAADLSIVTKKIAVNVKVTGQLDTDFYILFDEGNVNVEPYEYKDHDVLLTGSVEDILNIFESKTKFAEAVSTEKVTVYGNAEKAVIFVAAVF